MSKYIRSTLNWLSSPLWWKRRCQEWKGIAQERGEKLQAKTTRLNDALHLLDYYRGLTEQHDTIVAGVVRDMKAAQSLAKQWKAEADALTLELKSVKVRHHIDAAGVPK